MIRLNDAIYQSLILDEECPVSEMESHLIGLKLQLWPIFQKEMSSQLDSVKKLAASASGTAGLFGGKSAGIKEAVIQNASYPNLFLKRSFDVFFFTGYQTVHFAFRWSSSALFRRRRGNGIFEVCQK